MEKIIKIISENSPLVIANGRKVENFSKYYNSLDYTNNCLNSSHYNKLTNVLTLVFISEYAMKKINNTNQ